MPDPVRRTLLVATLALSAGCRGGSTTEAPPRLAAGTGGPSSTGPAGGAPRAAAADGFALRYVAAPGSPLPVGDGVGRPLLADMDGDEVLDLVVPSRAETDGRRGAGRVTVHIGRGDGRFGPPAGEATLPHAGLKIAAGDLDEDGHLDVAAVAHDAYAIHLLLGDGRGGFLDEHRSVAARTGDRPHTHAIATADLDDDGHADLLTTNADHGDVSVLLGDGTGGFAPAPDSPFTVGGHPYEGLSVTDLDGDGHRDVVVPDLHGGAVALLLGDGTGGLRLAPGSPHAVARRPGSVAAGDVDGDGHTDVLATHDGDPLLSVLAGTSSGWAPMPGSPWPLETRAWDVRVADLDGDGRAEIVLGGVGTDVLVCDAAGGDRLPMRTLRVPEVGDGPGYLALGDVDGDGRLDIVTGNFGGRDVSVLLAR